MMFQSRLALCAAGLVFGMAFSVLSESEVLSLSWNHPTQYTDNTAIDLLDIDSTEIKCSSFTPTGGAATTCPVTTTERVTAPASSGYFDVGAVSKGGTFCFQARTVMFSGQISNWSTTACKAITPKTPNPPTWKTIETVAYEIKISNRGEVQLRVAGTIELGQPCGESRIVLGEKSFHSVGVEQVQLASKRFRRSDLVAVCAESAA